jgi:hypothetical protein
MKNEYSELRRFKLSSIFLNLLGKKNPIKLSIQSCLLDFCYYYNIRSCSYNAKVYNDGYIANIEEQLQDICVCEWLHDMCVCHGWNYIVYASFMCGMCVCGRHGWNYIVYASKKRLAEATKADLAED